MAEGYRQLNVFDHLISQKVNAFRTFSKLLEALRYESAKFEVNFESLFERLVDYAVW